MAVPFPSPSSLSHSSSPRPTPRSSAPPVAAFSPLRVARVTSAVTNTIAGAMLASASPGTIIQKSQEMLVSALAAPSAPCNEALLKIPIGREFDSKEEAIEAFRLLHCSIGKNLKRIPNAQSDKRGQGAKGGQHEKIVLACEAPSEICPERIVLQRQRAGPNTAEGSYRVVEVITEHGQCLASPKLPVSVLAKNPAIKNTILGARGPLPANVVTSLLTSSSVATVPSKHRVSRIKQRVIKDQMEATLKHFNCLPRFGEKFVADNEGGVFVLCTKSIAVANMNSPRKRVWTFADGAVKETDSVQDITQFVQQEFVSCWVLLPFACQVYSMCLPVLALDFCHLHGDKNVKVSAVSKIAG